MLTIGGQRTAAHFMGSHLNLISDPGACAPGFMLTPASQATLSSSHETHVR